MGGRGKEGGVTRKEGEGNREGFVRVGLRPHAVLPCHALSYCNLFVRAVSPFPRGKRCARHRRLAHADSSRCRPPDMPPSGGAREGDAGGSIQGRPFSGFFGRGGGAWGARREGGREGGRGGGRERPASTRLTTRRFVSSLCEGVWAA
jgi:hypothetical protein